jgi:hypothetical protein
MDENGIEENIVRPLIFIIAGYMLSIESAKKEDRHITFEGNSVLGSVLEICRRTSCARKYDRRAFVEA